MMWFESIKQVLSLLTQVLNLLVSLLAAFSLLVKSGEVSRETSQRSDRGGARSGAPHGALM